MSYKRFIVISDLHFNDEIVSHMSDELNKFFFPYILENRDNLSALFIAGDLFDSKISFNSITSFSVLNFITKLLRYLKGIPLIILRGTRTHDFSQLDTFKFLEKKGVTVVNEFEGFEIDGVKILCLPEEYPKKWEEYYNFSKDDHYDMIVMHGMIDFASHSSGKVESEKEVPSSVVFPSKLLKNLATVTIAGHVHMPMENGSIYYCSSFTRFCFGEEESKGFIDVKVNPDDNSYKVKRIINEDAPEYKTVNLSEIYNPDITRLAKKVSKIVENTFSVRINLDMDETNGEEVLSNIAVLREHFGNTVKFKVMRIKDKKQEEEIPEEVVNILRQKVDVKQMITDLINQKYPDLNITLDDVMRIISK